MGLTPEYDVIKLFWSELSHPHNRKLYVPQKWSSLQKE
jgi:hypothetical protein